MLHELARQVKGEIAREVAEELAMARDLADELAEREAELGEMPDGSQGLAARSRRRRAKPGAAGQRVGRPLPGDLTDAERLERLEEAAKTLEQWLKDASLRAEGKPAERIRELARAGRWRPRSSSAMERIARALRGDVKSRERRSRGEGTLRECSSCSPASSTCSHRGIVAPELAELVEFDRRVAELTARLRPQDRRGDRRVAPTGRRALIRDLEKAGLTDAAAPGRCDRGGGPAPRRRALGLGLGDHRFRVRARSRYATRSDGHRAAPAARSRT